MNTIEVSQIESIPPFLISGTASEELRRIVETEEIAWGIARLAAGEATIRDSSNVLHVIYQIDGSCRLDLSPDDSRILSPGDYAFIPEGSSSVVTALNGDIHRPFSTAWSFSPARFSTPTGV